MASRSRGGCVVALLVLVGVAVAAIAYGPDLWHRYGDRLFSSERCTATVDGESSTLTAEQANNAAIVVGTALRRGLPERAATIALAAALQESDLRNLAVGDRDSLGLFQQRPSQGWGTAEQVTDPWYASGAFYDALVKIDGWETMSITDAAQAVQRSGFPSAYAKHEIDAERWATALSGGAGTEAVTCSLGAPTPLADPPMALLDRLSHDLGSIVEASTPIRYSGKVVIVLHSPDGQQAAAVAAWVVAASSALPVESVRGCDAEWSRTRGSWAPTEGNSTCEPSDVTVVLVAA